MYGVRTDLFSYALLILNVFSVAAVFLATASTVFANDDSMYGPQMEGGACPGIPNSFSSVANVSSEAGFIDAYSNAAPGDAIVIENGIYDWDIDKNLSRDGTQSNPIYVLAESLHGVIFNDNSGRFDLNGEWNVFAGFRFENSIDAPFNVGADNVRIACNYFERPSVQNFILVKEGGLADDVEIDNNVFDGNGITGSSGRWAVLLKGSSGSIESKRAHIHHNTWKNHPYANGDNGHEAIILGLGSAKEYNPADNMDAIVENNLFDGWNGEFEMISIKSSRNILRNNCFIGPNQNASIVIRSGHHNLIHGNWIEGMNAVFRDGGDGNHIVFNYLLGLGGNDPFLLHSGQFGGGNYHDPSYGVYRFNVLSNFRHWIQMMPVFSGGTLDKSPTDMIFSHNQMFTTNYQGPYYDRTGGVMTWQDYQAANTFTNNTLINTNLSSNGSCGVSTLFDGLGTSIVASSQTLTPNATIEPPSWWGDGSEDSTPPPPPPPSSDEELVSEPAWSSDWVNGSLLFDGIDDREDGNLIAFGDGFSLHSVSLWFKSVQLDGTIFGQNEQEVNRDGYKIYLDNGRVCTKILTNRCTSASYNDDSWHHVVLVRDETTSHALYIDGAEAYTTSGGGSFNDGKDEFAIGADYEGDFDGFNHYAGHIADVRIYDFALSESEVVGLHTSYDPNVVVDSNQAPSALTQNVQVLRDGSKAITLSGTDPDADTLSYTILAQPNSGSLSGAVPNLMYTPNGNYTGNDSFSFAVSDGELSSQPAVVSIEVVQPPTLILDTDGDGVFDESDRCAGTLVEDRSFVNNHGCPKPKMEHFDIKPNLEDDTLDQQLRNFEIGDTRYGRISFVNKLFKLTRTSDSFETRLDLDSFISFSPNTISIDTSNLAEFDKQATLTFYDVTVGNPQIKRDGLVCLDCTILTHTGGELVATVPGFSTYTVEEIETDSEPEENESEPTPSTGGGGSSSGGGGGSSAPISSGSSGGGSFVTSVTSSEPEMENNEDGVAIEEVSTTSTTTTILNNSEQVTTSPVITFSESTFSYSFTIKDWGFKGSRGESFRWLQKALNRLGYTISTSGAGSVGNETDYFGPATERALQMFQKDNEIVYSGSPQTTGYGALGPSTRAALNDALQKTSVISSAVANTTSIPEDASIEELQTLIDTLVLLVAELTTQLAELTANQ